MCRRIFVGVRVGATALEVERGAREIEREGLAKLEGAVNLELGAKIAGVLREPPQVLVQLGRFAVFLAQDDLVVNQVEQLFVVDGRRREFTEERFDRQPIPIAPALAMSLNQRERILARSHRPCVAGACRR